VTRIDLLLIAGLTALVATPVAAEVPMPKPRPAEAGKSRATPPLPAPRAAVRPTDSARQKQAARPSPPLQSDDAPCTTLLAEGIADVELNASVSGATGDDLCGDETPVRMTAIRLPDGGKIELKPAAVARCQMALTFANWVRHDVTRSLRPLGAELEEIEIAASYHCRPRNNVRGAKLSQHGLANAIDVSAFHLDDGRRIAVVDPKAPAYLFAELRLSACKRFTTVLGPGADAAHADHLHLDLAQRKRGYRLCQWQHADWLIP
jgi:hypothetical protein